MFVLLQDSLTAARPHGPRALPKRIGIFVLALLVGLFAGCEGGTDGTTTPGPTPPPAPPPPPVPSGVTVTLETVELRSPGATAQLAAEVRDQRGQVMTGVSITWASSDQRTAPDRPAAGPGLERGGPRQAARRQLPAGIPRGSSAPLGLLGRSPGAEANTTPANRRSVRPAAPSDRELLGRAGSPGRHRHQYVTP